MMSRRVALTGLAGTAAALMLPLRAKAADTLRVGKAVAENFAYVPLDVGIENGIFTRHGLAIETVGFTGGARIAQAMAAGAVDISLSAGPDMQFIVKGAPEIAIASITESPAFMGFCVGASSDIRSLDDLKAKKIGITSNGSLTYWLVEEMNRVKGWTAPGERAVQVAIGGSTAASLSAIKTGQVDASLSAAQTGFLLEHRQEGRLLADCSRYVGSIELFTTFASTALVARNPDAVQRFLAAWYEAVALMRGQKDETVRIGARAMGYPPEVAARSYDNFMPKFSRDGKFAPKAIETLADSFRTMKLLDGPAELEALYTERFLPRA
jgi:NitT/TauT family transport system substrate-binding protein